MLKLGVTFLDKGKWHDERIIASNWVTKSGTAFMNNKDIIVPNEDTGKNAYGYSWWISQFSYKGKKIGNLGHLTSFSFYANKNMTTGEGGMLTVNDDELAEKIRVLRLHGLNKDAWKRFGNSGFANWQLNSPGYKYNMTDISDALGIHQLKKVNKFREIRKRYAEIYDEAFKNIPELEMLTRKDYAQSAYHLYIIALRLDRLTISRDQFLNEIQVRGIGVAVYYVGLHLQPYYMQAFKTKAKDCPVASSYSERVLTLPLYPKMSAQDVNRVIETVRDLVQKYRR